MKVNRLPFTKMMCFFYQLSHPTKNHFLTKILHLPCVCFKKKTPLLNPRGFSPNINTPSQHLNRPTSAEARGLAFFWALGTATETATATTTALLQKTPSSLLTRDEILYSTNCHQVMFVGFCFFCKKMVLSELDSMVLRCIYLWVTLSKQNIETTKIECVADGHPKKKTSVLKSPF